MKFWTHFIERIRGPRFDIVLRVESTAPPRKNGDRSPDGRATYLDGGPQNDPTPIWTGQFPPLTHVEPRAPSVGMHCTMVAGEILSRGKIIKVGARTVEAVFEYKKYSETYSRRYDGRWRLAWAGRLKAPYLVLGIHATNVRLFKKWYSDAEIQSGWDLDH